MIAGESHNLSKQNTQLSGTEYSDFNTRVFWITYSLSIGVFFAWLSQ
jgi:hypothetical protein